MEIEKQKEYIQKVAVMNQNKNLKYHITTMGCQLNENDSEKICGMLTQMGYEETQDLREANFIIFNTCCVRENAEERLFGKLGEIKNLKKSKEILLAIGGCMMQEEIVLQKIKQSYPFVDMIFGTHTLHRLPQDTYEVLKKREKVQDVIHVDGEVYEGIPIRRSHRFKASVTIMYGCNNFCSYCIVPYVRGRERSRMPEEILKEVKELASKGYKEITLLGQNVNSYMKSEVEAGTCRSKINTFAKLLHAVCEIEGIEIVRFISPHPKDFSDDVIEAIRDCKKISRLIHLPLQSGSSKVLEKMNRKYTKEDYLQLVEKMKHEIEDVVFSTDIIVGFPGETEEDLEDTLDVVRKVNFEQIFMFIYSVREGTPAQKMENQIPEKIKHERFEKLKRLYDENVSNNNQKYLNTTQKILVDGTSKNNDEMLTGRTSTNKVVVFKGDKNLIGSVIEVKIIAEHKWYLRGIK